MITLKQKNHYLKHQVVILKSILEKYKPTAVCVACQPESEFFEDSCNFVGLHHAIFELKSTMENMIKYNECIMKEIGDK